MDIDNLPHERKGGTEYVKNYGRQILDDVIKVPNAEGTKDVAQGNEGSEAEGSDAFLQ